MPAAVGSRRLVAFGGVIVGVLALVLVDDRLVRDSVPADVDEQAGVAAAEAIDVARGQRADQRHDSPGGDARRREPPLHSPASPEPLPPGLRHGGPQPPSVTVDVAGAVGAGKDAPPTPPDGETSASSGGVPVPPGGAAATFGFYFPVYDQVPGVLAVVSRVRVFYPESPIHLLSDGGSVDFGRLCGLPKYACTFEFVQGENSRWNPHSWFMRMRAVALRLQTTFLIYLEPDVLVRRRHISEPQHDAGGILDNYNPTVHEETVAYVERRGRERVPCFQLEWKHFGLAGGSYFRTEAVVDAFDPAHVQRIDWGPMQWREGDKTMSSDFAMIVALACRGWKVSPWNESAQNFERRGLPPDEAGREEFGRQWPAYNPSAAFEHDHKEHYGDAVPEEEARLVRELSQTPITCHGCVWYGAEGARLPGSEPPRPPRVEDWYVSWLLTPDLAPRACAGGEPAARTPDLLPLAALAAAAQAYARLQASGMIFALNKECGSQARDFGDVPSPEVCQRRAAAAPECGGQLMFSHAHPDWGCRCCAPGGGAGGPISFFWDVFNMQKAEDGGSPGDAPPPPAPAAYSEAKALTGKECSEQGVSFGHIATVLECDRRTAAHPDCGYSFMFSPRHPDWQCRCCTATGRDDGPGSEHWNVYDVRTPRVQRPPTTTTTPDPLAGARGLPLLQERPDWLVKSDGLVVDARPSGQGGMVILQAVLMDVSGDWGKKQASRPRWLRSILATNRDHSRRFKHAMVVRWQKTQPQLTKWQMRDCERKGRSAQWCEREWERENINWEKHLMMSEYLLSSEGFSHVFMLDADAAIVRPDVDVLAQMADLLDSNSRELLLSDEDWLNHGKGRINGGLLFAKNTQFTRDLFRDTFDCHVQGKLMPMRIGVPTMTCGSNEQVALNDLLRGGGKHLFEPRTLLTSGMKYNRGGCVIHACGDGGMSDQRMHDRGMLDPDLYVMHFMGAMKGGAPAVLCGEGGSERAGAKDLTGDGPGGYGCQP